MSSLSFWVKRLHQALDNALLRALSLLLALMSAGLVMWDPSDFALAIGGFGPIISIALIWATCAALIFGVGFIPRRWYWQIIFTPYLAVPVLIYILQLRVF